MKKDMNKRIFEYDEYIRFLDNNANIFSKKNKYNIKYINSNIFLITGGKIYKEFRVPFLDEYALDKLNFYYNQLIDYTNSKDPYILYNVIKNIEMLHNFFIDVQPDKFSIKNNQDIIDSLSENEKKSLLSSEDQFLLTDYNDLDEDVQDKIFEYIKNRAEYMCCVIEAIFYYQRKINKKKYYNMNDIYEIFNKYQDKISELSKYYKFIYNGPYKDINNSNLITAIDKTIEYIYYDCIYENKNFIIRCVTSIDELYRLENITGLKGLKYTILNEYGNEEDDYENINEDNIIQMLDKYLNE